LMIFDKEPPRLMIGPRIIKVGTSPDAWLWNRAARL